MRRTSRILLVGYQHVLGREKGRSMHAYLSILATNMMSGISSEKPAELLVRCMLYIWSA